jgi:hypothetical protein
MAEQKRKLRAPKAQQRFVAQILETILAQQGRNTA